MELTNYNGLWALGFIPVLILIHSLRHRSVPRQTTTLFIWEQVLKQESGSVSLGSWIKNLSMLIQILIIILFSLGLAKPVWFTKKGLPQDHILVLDISASMKTTLESGNRFDHARTAAIGIIESLPHSDRAMILSAGTTPFIEQSFSSDRSALKQVLRKLKASDVPGDMEKAVHLAQSFSVAERMARIHVITDGAGYDLPSLTRSDDRIHPVIVPGPEHQPSRNVGITRFEFRKQKGSASGFEALVRVRNYMTDPAVFKLQIFSDRQSILDQKIGLDAGEHRTLIYRFNNISPSVLKAQVTVRDDFDVDNTVWAVFNYPPKLRVYLVSKGGFFINQILGVYPHLNLTVSESLPASSWDEVVSRNDIVILDRVAPQGPLNGSFLLIDSLPKEIPVTQAGIVDTPKILGWNSLSPIANSLRHTQFKINTAKKVRLDKQVTPVLASDHSPLIYTFHDDRVKAVIMGFDLENSDLPLRVAFPVLIKNMIQWLAPEKQPFAFTSLAAGQPFAMELSPHETRDDSVQVRLPSNRWERFRVSGSRFEFNPTHTVGLYKVKTSGQRTQFSVNLFNENESDITIRRGHQVNHHQDSGTGLIHPVYRKEGMDRKKSAKPIWPLVLAMALILIGFEFMLWLQRIKGR